MLYDVSITLISHPRILITKRWFSSCIVKRTKLLGRPWYLVACLTAGQHVEQSILYLEHDLYRIHLISPICVPGPVCPLVGMDQATRAGTIARPVDRQVQCIITASTAAHQQKKQQQNLGWFSNNIGLHECEVKVLDCVSVLDLTSNMLGIFPSQSYTRGESLNLFIILIQTNMHALYEFSFWVIRKKQCFNVMS